MNLNVLNAQEQYRIKSVSTGKYLHIFNHDQHSGGQFGGVGVSDYEESVNQIFTFEPNSTGYRVKSADGYYIYCQQWNVDAYNTSSYFSTTLTGFDFNGESFSIGRMYSSSEYFKVEYVSAGGNTYVFCNCTGNGDGTIETWKLEPVIVDDGIIPAAPTNLVATAIDHKSISLTWTAGDENALKYNIYQGGVNIGSTTETPYTVEGLTAETNYCFTVEAVRGVNVSESHSNEACATTGVAPKTQKIIFVLGDPGYGDGWNGNKLTISYEGFSEDLTLSSGYSATYERELPQGAEVKLEYKSTGSFQSENSFEIKYEDGEVIWSKAWGEIQYSENPISYTFTVKSNDPTVEVNYTSLDFGTVRAGGDFWTEKETPSFNVNVKAKYTTIKTITGNDDFFKFSDVSGAVDQTEFNFTVSYNKEAEAGYKSGNIVVTYMNGEEEATVEIPMTATAYEPVQGDVVENPIEVTFDENGVYTYTINSLDGFYDDYVFSPNEQYDADAPDMVFSFTLTDEALVTISNLGWSALYGDYTVENGPQYDVDYPDSNTLLSAGTYYAVCYPNSCPSEFSITKSSVPAPEISYSNPTNESANNDNPELTWNMKYAETYKVMLGTSEDALEEVASETATQGQTEYSFQTSELQNNTKYYWQVIATNEAGTTTGVVRSFVTLLDVPQITSPTTVNLYPGETTTITWDAVDNATSYTVYNGEWTVLATLEATETSYELSGLEYNMTGHNITVTATQDLGESLKSTAVVVKVAGTFPLTVNVKDSNNKPIEGAIVTVDMAKAYDEFGVQVADMEAVTTDAEGKVTITLPLLGAYGQYGSSWFTPYYTLVVSKSPYTATSTTVSTANGTPTSRDFTLYLPTPSNLYAEEDMLLAGQDLTLNWTAVEDVTGYNVYKTSGNGVYTFVETVTENTYTAVAEYDAYGSKYAVSAVFEGGLESDKAVTYDYIYVLGTGDVKGLVTDTEGNPVAGAALELSGTNGFGEDIHILETEADGTFLVEYVIEGAYSLTVSHYNYEAKTVSGIIVEYNNEYDFGTIELTPKASIENVTVTADNNGNVSWTGDYTKWKVYRRNTNAQQELETVATELTTTSTTDAAWETLEPGTYQYGVAALVEPQAQTRGTEVIFEEGFENNGTNIPTGWSYLYYSASYGTYNTTSNYCWKINQGDIYYSYTPMDSYSACVNNGGNSVSNAYSYLVSSQVDLSNKQNPKLSFYYITPQYNSSYPAPSYVNTLKVKILTSEDQCSDPANNGEVEWTSNATHVDVYTASGEIDLSDYVGQIIYIVFETDMRYGRYTALDNVQVSAEGGAIETQIVWSNNVVKQGPATFIGGDTENPTEWNVDANWSTGSVPADGAEVTINANAVITGEVNVSNVTINAGTSLTVANGGALTVTGTISQASDYLLVLEEGGQIFQNNANVTARFRMSIDNPEDWSDEANKDGWQFISMPLENVPHTDFTSYGEYDLYKYDGSQNLEWQNHKDGGFEEEAFKSGVGYLASLKDAEIATVYGTLNTATPFVFSGYNQIIYNEEKDLANFRLFGNPFTYDIYMSDFDLDFYNDGENDFVSGYAVVNNSGSYDYRTIEPIKVGEGFFVKALSSTAIAYAPASKRSENKSDNSLNITATGNAGEDNVIINLAGKSEGFNKLQNFNDAIATVYVAEDGKNYGIYNCDADVQEVELSFNANQMGNYTISIEPNGKFQTVTLVDRFTGIETNMLVEDYHFTAMSNVNTNRFIIKMVNGQQTTDNSHFVFQSGEDLIIDAEGTVQIIDVMGRVLVSDEVESTNNRINVSGFQNGTYMVRVINGSEVKVEKVVIY